VAVVELGMNHPGEIAELAAIAEPTVALVNNAARAPGVHGHGRGGGARERRGAGALAPTAWPCFRPTILTPLWRPGRPRKLLFASRIRAHRFCSRPAGSSTTGRRAPHAGRRARFELHVAGRHNVRNALAARPARWPGRRWRRWRRA
jgi:UDP-N-acetylmuramoyl-tripeptide--D-alanyl-D-alanine ligase